MTVLGTANSATSYAMKGYELIEVINISSAVTTQDFSTVLDGDNDGGYIIELNIVNGAAASTNYSIRVNAATWAVNRQYIYATSTTLSGARDTGTSILAIATSAGDGDEGIAFVRIPFSKTGRQRLAYCEGSHAGSTTSFVELFNMFIQVTTPATTTNITSLGVVASQTSGIGVGSVMRLYKLIA